MAIEQLTLPSETVKMANELVRGQLRLKNATAIKIFVSVVSCIHKDDVDFKDYVMPAKSVLMDPGGNDYTLMHKAIKTITDHSILIPENDHPERPSFAAYPLFSKVTYSRKDDTITASINPFLKPYLLQLKQYVLFNKIDSMMLANSGYSFALFALLSSYNKTHSDVKVELEELHAILNTAKGLRRWQDFKRDVLDRAHKEINLKTGLAYTWEAVKHKNKVVAVNFIFNAKAAAAKEEAKKVKVATRDKTASLAAMECLRKKGLALGAKCPDQSRRLAKCRRCERIRGL